MKEFKTFAEFRLNIDLIPNTVAIDVMKRINDWLSSGGKEEDPYIQKQLKFASYFIGKSN